MNLARPPQIAEARVRQEGIERRAKANAETVIPVDSQVQDHHRRSATANVLRELILELEQLSVYHVRRVALEVDRATLTIIAKALVQKENTHTSGLQYVHRAQRDSEATRKT
jgi:hypothetical protein